VLFSPSFMQSPHQVLSVFEMSPLARELVRECRDWGPENEALSPFANRIFATLAMVVTELSLAPSKCVLPSPVSAQLKKAVQLTEGMAHSDPKFDEIARLSNMSPRSMARRFSTEMGLTWSEVLRRSRIIKAVETLATTDCQITEIALSVGYNSLSAFNAAFREMMQMSPTEYRASFRD
jgi:AraC-like DNA-binding protein